MLRNTRLLSLATILITSLAAACSSSSSDPSPCATLAAVTESCFPNAVDQQFLNCVDPVGPEAVATNCAMDCYANASCADVQADYCGGTVSSNFEACMVSCFFFACGNGTSVTVFDLCDGYNDCGNNADENGCDTAPPMWTCSGSAEEIPLDSKCDGYEDCANGADETIATCGAFNCGNGSTIPASLACDGWDDCGNLADEDECMEMYCY